MAPKKVLKQNQQKAKAKAKSAPKERAKAPASIKRREYIKFAPPQKQENHVAFLDAQLKRMGKVAEELSDGKPVVYAEICALQEFVAALREWVFKSTQLTWRDQKRCRDAVVAVVHDRVYGSNRSMMGEFLKKCKKDIEAKQSSNEAKDAKNHEIRVKLSKMRSEVEGIEQEIKEMDFEAEKSLERKQGEIKVIEEMRGRLEKNLQTAKSRRTVILRRQQAQEAAAAAQRQAPQAAAAASSQWTGAASSSVGAASSSSATQEPIAPKAKAKTKAKGKAKAKGPAARPGSLAVSTPEEAAARREYELDRRMQIAEAAQPIPGLMPQFNKEGRTVGWMDTNGNWISGETSRGSKKLLLHLKAINYDPRVDPDQSDDSTPVAVRAASTPPGMGGPITPISRLTDEGGETTDIPTSPLSDEEEAARPSLGRLT